MTTKRGWDEVKASRADSPARRRGYEKAGRAIRLAGEIRALRESRGLSQRELAELVRTTQSAIARLEGGHVSPSLATLDRIADALGVELHHRRRGRRVADRAGPGVDQATYHLVAEALDNVIHHAEATSCTVVFRHEGQDLVGDVVDDGVGAWSGRPGRVDGHRDRFGHSSLAARAAAVGGQVLAVPRPDGGYRVRAVIPSRSA